MKTLKLTDSELNILISGIEMIINNYVEAVADCRRRDTPENREFATLCQARLLELDVLRGKVVHVFMSDKPSDLERQIQAKDL